MRHGELEQAPRRSRESLRCSHKNEHCPLIDYPNRQTIKRWILQLYVVWKGCQGMQSLQIASKLQAGNISRDKPVAIAPAAHLAPGNACTSL